MGCSLLEDEQRQWQRGTSNDRMSIWQTKKNKEEKEFTRRILLSPLFFPSAKQSSRGDVEGTVATNKIKKRTAYPNI